MKNLLCCLSPLRALLILSFGLGASLGASLGAGVRYEMNLTNFSDASERDGGAVTIWVDDGKMKVQGADLNGGEMVFNLAKKEMLFIDHEEKSYTVLDEQTVEKFSAQVSSAMAEYERALENVPPQQRKMMENMLKKQMPQMHAEADAKQEIKVEATGVTETINGYKARAHEIYINGKKTQEVLVTNWENIKGNEALMDVFEGMGGFFTKMMSAFSQGPLADMIPAAAQGNWINQITDLNGFPVLVREFAPSGELSKETRLSKVEETSFDKDVFEVPASYKRRSLPLE